MERRHAISAVRRQATREDRLAGVLGGLLFLAGGLSIAFMVALPGAGGDHEDLALLAALVAGIYGLASASVVPWERLPFAALHAATIGSLGIVTVVAAWTGGAQSPTRLLVAFVVVWAACFCRPAVIAGYIALTSLTFLGPLAYDDTVPVAVFVREQVVVMSGLGAIALTVALLRRAVDNAERRAAARATEQAALRTVATAVADGRSPDAIHDLVAREAARVLDADAGAVLRFDGETAVVVGAWSATSPRLPAGTVLPLVPGTPLTEARRRDRAVVVGHDGVTLAPAVVALGYASMAAAPIHVDGVTWGAIAVSTEVAGALEPSAGARLQDFGELVTTAIVNAEQHERLAAQAYSDPLTGLANHRTFHERLGTEVARARRHGRDLSLVLLDVDAFKAVNDGSGHEAGDRLLAAVAERLRDIARGGDLVARIGGDEFGWLLPETDAEAALAVVERARDAVASLRAGPGDRVTISAGVCDMTRADDADELFRLADGALYWSKAHGRDAARVYDPETVRELSAAERADQLARHQALLGIRALARAIDAKDPTTHEHSGRVAGLACALAEACGWPADRVAALEEAALVHDVGKIGIADAILLKPGRLDDAEYEEVKRHAELGAQIVEDVLTAEQVEWIRHHHERPDGRGYPDGLTAAELSPGAALLALADAFDVMTAARPYSTPKPYDVALAECRELVGRQFTADAVAALERLAPCPAVPLAPVAAVQDSAA